MNIEIDESQWVLRWDHKDEGKEKVWRVSKERTLGEGSFSKCYLVQDLDSPSDHYALKVIPKEKVDDSYKRQQFYNEVKIHRLLSHPSIVTFVDCFETDESVCILLGYCNDGCLSTWLDRHLMMDEVTSCKVIFQLLKGVAYLHECGILHRDIKAANVFFDVNPDDGDVKVKLGDFGFATATEEKDCPWLCGTPNYISPEIARDGDYTPAGDIWAVGILLYLLLYGIQPFGGKDVDKTLSNICKKPILFPETPHLELETEDLLKSLLEKNPTKRLTAKGALNHKVFDLLEIY